MCIRDRNTAWITGGNDIGRNILCDDASGTDNGITTNGDTWKNGDITAHPDVIANSNRKRLFQPKIAFFGDGSMNGCIHAAVSVSYTHLDVYKRQGKYGLPTQAPGGKTGTPDIVFAVDDLHIVIELTTIKAKSLQFSARCV